MVGKTDKICTFVVGKTDVDMIKRKIISKLENFYKSSENAMLITGARQVGKTYAIRQFGKTNFACFVEFNFLENLEARHICSLISLTLFVISNVIFPYYFYVLSHNCCIFARNLCGLTINLYKNENFA